MSKRLLVGAVIAVIWALTLAAAFLLGGLAGSVLQSQQRYRQQYEEELRIVEPLLESDEAFSSVEVGRVSNGGVYIGGEVPTPRDRERLREKLAMAFGQNAAEEFIRGVDVTSDAGDTGTTPTR